MTKPILAARLLPLFLALTTLHAQVALPPESSSGPASEQSAFLRNSIATDPANLQGERVGPQPLADTLPLDHGAPALEQLLLKLRTRASLMLIVAHPDDEDGGMLTYESRGQGVRTAMLTLNRGEGGQNLMSSDFNDALGLLRTQELLAEDRYTGVDQFFGTEVDFGFSKTKEETFAQWTHDRVLYDAVRAVRLYRPLVLASVFVGGPTDGHGHHQVSGEICQEVFLAAADPKIFPEMNLPPWTPLKVYARVPFSRVTAEGMFDYATGNTVPTFFHNYVTGLDIHTAPTATVDIHEGDPAVVFNKPALGMEGLSYVQWARKGLALQQTQIGPNVRLAPVGRADSGYTLMATRVGCSLPSDATAFCPTVPATETSLFDGIDTSLPSLSADSTTHQALLTIDSNLAQAESLFDPANIELTAPPLRDALRKLDELIASLNPAPENFDVLHELRIKRVELNDALALAHHLSLAAALTPPVQTYSAKPEALPAQLLSTISSLAATLTLANDGADSMRIASTQLTVNLAQEGIGAGSAGSLEPRSTQEIPLRLPYLAGLFPTKPYFSRPNDEQPFYDIAVPALRNAPQTPAPIVAHATLDDQGVTIELAAIVPSPVVSTPQQPLVVIPPVSVELSPAAAILLPGQQALSASIHLSGQAPKASACAVPNPAPPEGKVGLIDPAADPGDEVKNWGIQPETQGYDPDCPNAHPDFAFSLKPPAALKLDTPTQFLAIARAAARNYNESYRSVGYPGLTATNLYTAATLKVVGVDVVTAPGLRVAYLPGTGDEVPAFLPNLGVTATPITTADLTPDKLAAFDVVLLGVRAYAAHPKLAGAGSKPLNDFAQAGGVVIVQYNSASEAAGTAPYSFTLPGDSAHNVVDETDPVTLLDALRASAQLPQQDNACGLQWLDRGARAWLRLRLGSRVHAAARNPRPRPGAATRRPARGQGGQGRLHLLCVRALSAAARCGARRLPADGQPAELREGPRPHERTIKPASPLKGNRHAHAYSRPRPRQDRQTRRADGHPARPLGARSRRQGKPQCAGAHAPVRGGLRHGDRLHDARGRGAEHARLPGDRRTHGDRYDGLVCAPGGHALAGRTQAGRTAVRQQLFGGRAGDAAARGADGRGAERRRLQLCDRGNAPHLEARFAFGDRADACRRRQVFSLERGADYGQSAG